MLLALSFIVRPTNSIALICLCVWALGTFRRAAWPLVSGIALAEGGFLLFSLSTFGALLPPYYSGAAARFSLVTMPETLLGLLFSPGRGLFIYSPVLVLSIIGELLLWRQRGVFALIWRWW